MSKGELELVEWLRENLTAKSARVEIGIGDDMAAVRLDGQLVAITSDMLLDGVHFDTQAHSYELIGRKAIACSLSDCAGMACEPRGATVSLALNNQMQMEDVKSLYEGMKRLADEFNCPIVGGDTTSWNGGLAIDVAMIAEPMLPRGPIRRSSAQPGDTIYVSGPLGGSIRGKHLKFIPRLDLARKLAHESAVHGMMDISDGLSLDLHRLCLASRVRAELLVAQMETVVSDDAKSLAQMDGKSPIEHALTDGEDFELLVCGDASLEDDALGLRAVGHLRMAENGEAKTMILLEKNGMGTKLHPQGYEHFR
jgi:thiamine-monophosphate kinase